MSGPKVETSKPPKEGPLSDSLEGQMSYPKPSGEPKK